MKTLLSIGVLSLGLAASAQAGVIFDAQGFEGPAYTPGNIAGQNGWLVDPTSLTAHQVVGTVGSVVPIGSQMLSLTQPTGTASGFSFPDISAGVAARPTGEDWIWNQFDLFMPSTVTTTGNFGVIAFNAAGSLIGGIRVRGSDGQLIGSLGNINGGTLAFNNYLLGITLPRNQWINLGYAINVATGAAVITSGSNILFTGTAGAGFATLSDFDAFSSAVTSGPQTAFLDNYLVTSNTVVPAPGAAALFGAGGLLAARRRRR